MIYGFSTRLGFCLAGILLLTGCESAYYGAWEKVGVHKRDILVDRVEDAAEAQEDAKEEFKSALEKFSSVVRPMKMQIQGQRKSVIGSTPSRTSPRTCSMSGQERSSRSAIPVSALPVLSS